MSLIKPQQPEAQSATPAPAVARSWRRPVIFAIQATLSGVLAYMVLRGLDWRSLAQMAGRQSLGFFVGSSLLSLLVTLLYAVRWREVLLAMGHRMPVRGLAWQLFVGVFFNNFAPSMLGQDAVKSYYLGRDTGYATAVVSVLVDKVVGLLSMTLLGAALLVFLDLKGPIFDEALGAALLFSVGCAALLLAARLPLERLVPPSLGRWALGRRLLDLLTSSRASAGSAVSLRMLAASLGLMVLSMTMQALIYFWFLQAATGDSPGILELAGALCLVTTVTNMPVSVNGIGVREQAHALVLTALGVPLTAAVGLSLLQYVFMLGQSLIGWALWVTRPRRTEG